MSLQNFNPCLTKKLFETTYMKSTNENCTFRKKNCSGYVFDINVSNSDVEMKMFQLLQGCQHSILENTLNTFVLEKSNYFCIPGLETL